MVRRDLVRHMPRHWIFDLDNTLYPPAVGIATQCNARIVLFLQQLYGIEPVAARHKQRELIARHGTTLRGVMSSMGVDPAEFLAFEEDLDYSGLQPDAALRDALLDLPGQRIVFTNGSVSYATRLIQLLDLTEAVDGMWGIDSADFTPKPWEEAYRQCFDRYDVEASDAVFFDDLARNLEVPKRLGMHTVWVAPDEAEQQAPLHVDVVASDVLSGLKRLTMEP